MSWWQDISITRFVPKVFTKTINGEPVRASIDRFDIWCNNGLHYPDTYNKYVQLQERNYVLNNVIGKIASSLSNAHFSDESGNDTALLKKINNPNQKQSREEFLKEFAIYLNSAGWMAMWKRYVSIGNFETMELINLNPDECIPGEESISFCFEGKDYKVLKSEFIFFYDNRRDHHTGKGISRIKPLRSQVNNTQDAQVAKNIQIVNSGVTVVSPKASLQQGNMDQGMDTPITTPVGNMRTQKDDMEDKLNTTTIANRIIVASKGLDAVNLSAALGDIDFDDKTEDDKLVIADAFGVPVELTPWGKNATFDNKEVAETALIERESLPLAKSLAESLNSEFPKQGKLTVDFNHVSSVAIKNNKINDTNKVIVDTYISMVNAGLITAQDAKRILTDKGILL